MRVERLEVFGFKSFMERLVLPLERGITGVVGPNGCGKSNVVDALRWVLGETRASQLRGDVLEDVIFNGTESLRPLGLAEVSVVLRADTESFYHDLLSYYEQVESAAPPELSGAHKAEPERGGAAAGDAAEGGPAHRQLEVVDGGPAAGDSAADMAVPDSGASPASSELRAQVGSPEGENTDQLPAAVHSSERGGDAASPESAAPTVSPEVAAAEEASSFVADIKASLSKYAWLQSVSEVQVTRRLYRSGESEFFINKVSCRLKDVRELFRVVGLAARGYTIIAQGEIGRIISAKPDDRRLVIEEAAHIAGFREHMNAVGKRLSDTQAQLVRMDDVIKEVTRQVANLKRQATRAVTRAQLKAELSAAERVLFTDTLARLRNRLEQCASTIKGLVEQEQVAQQELQAAQGDEQRAREESMRFDTEIEQLRLEADKIKEELSKRGRELSLAEARLREITSLLQARSTEVRRLEERRVLLTQRQRDSREALGRFEAHERELTEALAALDLSGEDELKQLSQDLQVLRDDQRAKDRTIRELRDTLVSAQSRREALQAQLTAASPIAHLKRALGGEQKLPVEVTRDHKLLVDGLTVPERYAKAVQAVLAERASFLVVDDVTKVARAFQEAVLKADPSNKKGLGVGLFAALDAPAAGAAESAEGLIDGVVPLFAQLQTAAWSRGIVERLLASVYVAVDLDVALKFLEQRRANGTLDHDLVVVTESGDLLSGWSFYSLRHDGGVIQMKGKVDQATRIIEENQGGYDQLVAARDAVVARIAAAEKRHAELVRSIQQAQARLRELSTKQAEVRGRLQSERKMLAQIDGDLQRLEPQAQELQRQLEGLESSSGEVRGQIEVLKQRDDSEVRGALERVSGALRELEAQRRTLRDSSSQMLRAVELKRRSHEGCRERLMRERMAGERLQGELSSAQSGIRERLGEEVLAQVVEAVQSVELLAEQQRRELEARVAGVRQRLEREGEVDPGVVEQHEAESKRLDDLTTQRDDLNSAITTLNTTLGELSEACIRRFLSTFGAISKNFAFFGPKLFGGGSAELRLINPEDPLASGVEVLVRPPGKKPKSIDLLSGGEKALCAIALVFSMFMVRPSPLCVLDEVDAPLDEANVQRFIAFIKEMSQRTQFLMITHNKASMAAADTLVGVTMPTPGASKILTVSLQEAVQQVA